MINVNYNHFILLFSSLVMVFILVVVIHYCVIYLCRYSYRLNRIAYYLELVLVPIHEFSHLVVALFFCHSIDGVQFFNKVGSTAHVSHHWSRYSTWSNIGSMFVPIAPFCIPYVLSYLVGMFNDGYLCNSFSHLFKVDGLIQIDSWNDAYQLISLDVSSLFYAIVSSYNQSIFLGARDGFIAAIFSIVAVLTYPSITDILGFFKAVARNFIWFVGIAVTLVLVVQFVSGVLFEVIPFALNLILGYFSVIAFSIAVFLILCIVLLIVDAMLFTTMKMVERFL